MSVRVATALLDKSFEADVVHRLARADAGATVVRRCRDIIELRSAAAAHLVDVVAADAHLRGLDRTVVTELHSLGVRVIAVKSPSPTNGGDHHLLGLGCDAVISASAEELIAAMRGAIAAQPSVAAPAAPAGKLFAVWGPLGSPGRTTIASSLADALAKDGAKTLLADADTYGASVAQHLGLLDDSSGLAAACRLAASGRLDHNSLARCTVALPGGLRVLTGVPRADRWGELQPALLDLVWETTRDQFAYVVVDVGFCIELDELAWAEPGRSQRNQASIATLSTADDVIAVTNGTPVGLVRFIQDFGDLKSRAPTARIHVLANRVSKSDQAQTRRLLIEHCQVEDVTFIPRDNDNAVSAWFRGQAVLESSRRSPLRKALEEFARQLTGESDRRRRRRTA